MKIELKILNKEFYKDYGCKNEPHSVDEYKDHCEYWRIQREDRHSLPTFATPGSAAIDLIATQDVTIYPGEVVEIRTGLAIHIGSNYKKPGTINDSLIHHNYSCDFLNVAGLILPRSGLGSQGLILANTVGLLDEDYQGEIVVKAWNRNLKWRYKDFDTKHLELNNQDIVKLEAGDRFAQLLFIPIIRPTFEIVEEFSQQTQRGDGGFNSTGN